MLLQNPGVQGMTEICKMDVTSTGEASRAPCWKLLFPPLNPASILSALSYGIQAFLSYNLTLSVHGLFLLIDHGSPLRKKDHGNKVTKNVDRLRIVNTWVLSLDSAIHYLWGLKEVP